LQRINRADDTIQINVAGVNKNDQGRIMKIKNTLSCIIALLVANSVSAAVLTVDAKSDIFGAGHSFSPGGGLLPVVYSFSAGTGLVFTASSITGVVSSGANITGPDGAHGGPSTDMDSIGGISGIVDSDSGFFLIGVFESDAEPTDPAPARLDFSPDSIGENFTTLSPQLNQTFFIGDGLTGTSNGIVQQIEVPENATRLFLGFADGNTAGINSDAYNYHGSPGYYSDNTGSLEVTFSIEHQAETTVRCSQIEISWPSQRRQLYQVQYLSPQTKNTWQNLRPPIIGNGTTNHIYVTISPSNEEISYRVLVLR
jgi:hypothetical protein